MQTNSAPPTATVPRQRDARGHFIPRGATPPRTTASVTTATAKPIAPGPRALDPTPPVLALFRHDAIAILRIHDLAFSGVVSAVVQSLPPDVTTLMLVTPTDTKMFQVNAGGGTQHARRPDTRDVREVLPNGVGAVGAEASSAEEMEPDPQEVAARLAAEGDRAAEEAGLESAAESAAAEVATADTPAARRRAMNELRRAEAGDASDPCGRCGGQGKIAIALPDGGASEAACGVCRGAGVIRRYGVRR
jgi:hypothetical protein